MFSDLSNAATAWQNLWLWKRTASDETEWDSSEAFNGSINAILSQQAMRNDCFPMESQAVPEQLTHRLATQLEQNFIPGLEELISAFLQEPDSPQNRYLQHRYTYLLCQKGPLGELRSQQLNLLLAIYQRRLKLRKLSDLLGQQAPDSAQPPASHRYALHHAIQHLQTVIEESSLHLEPLLVADPSWGGGILIKKKLRLLERLYQWLYHLYTAKNTAPPQGLLYLHYQSKEDG